MAGLWGSTADDAAEDLRVRMGAGGRSASQSSQLACRSVMKSPLALVFYGGIHRMQEALRLMPAVVVLLESA